MKCEYRERCFVESCQRNPDLCGVYLAVKRFNETQVQGLTPIDYVKMRNAKQRLEGI